MHALFNILLYIKSIITGPTVMILLLLVGIFFSFRLHFFQIRGMPTWLRFTVGHLFKKQEAAPGSLTPVQALATSLAASIGTGNMVGVATALVAGGPGAIFWMWVSAIFGMMTKYAEVVLGVYYRKKNAAGEWIGGPMYYMEAGLGKYGYLLANLFALFGALAAFGIGNMTQINSISTSIETLMVEQWVCSSNLIFFVKLLVGVACSCILGLVIIGGIKRIAQVAEKLIFFLSFFYIIGSLIAIGKHMDAVVPALIMICKSAFSTSSVTGGILGFTVSKAISYGISRGIFSHEAGLGSAPIAYASSESADPVEQGLWGILEVFIDTIVICTLTALVILTSGISWQTSDGAALTIAAYRQSFGIYGSYFIAISITLYGFATILTWALYGKRCYNYFCKGKATFLYQMLYLLFVIIAAIMDIGIVWHISDVLNNLMALPNIIALLLLSNIVVRISKKIC